MTTGVGASTGHDLDLSLVHVVPYRVLYMALSLLERRLLWVYVAILAFLAVGYGLRVELNRGTAGRLRLGGLLCCRGNVGRNLRYHIVVAHGAILVLIERLHRVIVNDLVWPKVHMIVILL